MKNVVIGKPLVPLHLLYEDDDIDLITNERFLPKILVKLGIFPSNSQVRKNRPDLFVELSEPDFLEIKVGKHRIWITVGVD